MKDQKFKGEKLTEKKCINSILRFYSLASITEIKEGLLWYNEANTYCRELAARFNITIQQTAGLIAVFSPQTGWTENKRFALSFLYNNKLRIKSQVQTDKALRILKHTSEDIIYNSLAVGDGAFKTKAFFKNILNPNEITDVTIDRHSIAFCIQRPETIEPLSNRYGKLTAKQYLFFQSCYLKAAKQLDILPQQLQAIVWTTYRRLRELRQYTDEKDFLPF